MRRIVFTIMFLCVAHSIFATEAKKQLQLNLQAQYGATDQTTIYFDIGVSPVFLSAEDAPKEMNYIDGVPNLYSLSTDNIKCSINGYSNLAQSAVIGIGVGIDSSALYTISLSGLSHFDSTTLIILEDRKMNVFTEMQTNFYLVMLTPDDSTGRFFLHVTRAVQFTQDTAGCANNNGAILINSDSTITWNAVSLLDSANRPITTYNNASGQFAFNGLAEGSYDVLLNYSGYSVIKTIAVSGTHIVASFTASSQNVAVGETIYFYSTTLNTTGYVWTFGDSTIITGVANPTYFYYVPGVYIVDLHCTNSAGCSVDVQTTITVGDPAGIVTPVVSPVSIINLGAKTIEVLMNNNTLNNTELQVYNILGQVVYSSPVTENQMQVSLNNEPAGIYVVTVKNNGKYTSSKVYITN